MERIFVSIVNNSIVYVGTVFRVAKAAIGDDLGEIQLWKDGIKTDQIEMEKGKYKNTF